MHDCKVPVSQGKEELEQQNTLKTDLGIFQDPLSYKPDDIHIDKCYIFLIPCTIQYLWELILFKMCY